MPSGKVHDTIALISIVPVFLTGNYLLNFNAPQVYIFTFVTLFSQLMFGPDLDVQSRQYKRWGIFRWIWIPYMKIFGHRSSFSHGILLGPIFRCFYLFIVFSIIFWIIDFFMFCVFNTDISGLSALNIVNTIKLSEIDVYLIPLFMGIFLGAAIHTISDKVFSFFKNLI